MTPVSEVARPRPAAIVSPEERKVSERRRCTAAGCEEQGMPAVELAEPALRLDAGGVSVALVDELAPARRRFVARSWSGRPRGDLSRRVLPPLCPAAAAAADAAVTHDLEDTIDNPLYHSASLFSSSSFWRLPAWRPGTGKLARKSTGRPRSLRLQPHKCLDRRGDARVRPRPAGGARANGNPYATEKA